MYDLKWDSGSGMGVTPVSTGQTKTVLLSYITRCDNTGEVEICMDQVVALNEGGKKAKLRVCHSLEAQLHALVQALHSFI